MQVLVVDDDEMMRSIIFATLENKVGATVIEASSGNKAIAYLKECKGKVDYIVSDYNMPDGTGWDLYQYVKKLKSEIPFILCTSQKREALEDFGDEVPSGFLMKPNVTKPLVDIIGRLEKSWKQISDSKAHPAYCGIRLSTLSQLTLLPCDLYLKLSETKFVKILHAKEAFGEEEHKKYTKKGVLRAYVNETEFGAFLDELLRNLLGVPELKKSLRNFSEIEKIIEGVQDLSIKEDLRAIVRGADALEKKKLSFSESVQITEQSLKSVKAAYDQFGFNDEVKELTKASVALSVKTLVQIPELSLLLRKASVDPASYIPSHSVQLAHVSCLIASLMTWTSDLTRYKLSLAAFLHDLTIDDQELAKLQTVEEIEKLDERLMPKLQKHPEIAAQLVNEFQEIPPDVDLIIIQHHERPDGSGFPSGIGGLKINPLSAVFIVAHDVVNFYFLHKGRTDLKSFLDAYKGSYVSGYFKKVSSALEKHIKELSSLKVKKT